MHDEVGFEVIATIYMAISLLVEECWIGILDALVEGMLISELTTQKRKMCASCG